MYGSARDGGNAKHSFTFSFRLSGKIRIVKMSMLQPRTQTSDDANGKYLISIKRLWNEGFLKSKELPLGKS